LTAAALAESMKEEIFTIQDNTDPDESPLVEDDVDLTTVSEAEVVERQVEETISPLKDQISLSAPVSAVEQLATTDGQISAPEVPHTVLTSPKPHDDNGDSSVHPLSLSGIGYNGDTEDWESLISFSEAGDTSAEYDLSEQTHDMQIPIGQSIREALEDIIDQDTEDEGVFTETQAKGESVPNDTVGLNENGQFVSPEINFFRDGTESKTSNDMKRLSLDNAAIFSFSAEQALITSPPKRDFSSISQPDKALP
jgi:hypothetical protein